MPPCRRRAAGRPVRKEKRRRGIKYREPEKIEMIKKKRIEGSDQAKTKNGKRTEKDDEDDGKE